MRSSASTTTKAPPGAGAVAAARALPAPASSPRPGGRRTKLSATQRSSPSTSRTGSARTRYASAPPGRPRSRTPSCASPVRKTRRGRQSEQRWLPCQSEEKQWSSPHDSAPAARTVQRFAHWMRSSRSTSVSPIPSAESASPRPSRSSGARMRSSSDMRLLQPPLHIPREGRDLLVGELPPERSHLALALGDRPRDPGLWPGDGREVLRAHLLPGDGALPVLAMADGAVLLEDRRRVGARGAGGEEEGEAEDRLSHGRGWSHGGRHRRQRRVPSPFPFPFPAPAERQGKTEPNRLTFPLPRGYRGRSPPRP